MPDWNPNLYLKFSDQRARPAADLIAQIRLENPRRIIDLGCGTGNSTEQLHHRWPEAEITGLDSSPEMLRQARLGHPDWNWIESPIQAWRPEGSYDVVFSNAALHWVADHESVFPRLLSFVSPGGVLAVQMPNNFLSPAHQGMKKVAQDPCWAGALDGTSDNCNVQPIKFYYRVLSGAGRDLNLWEIEYLQIMNSTRAILDWMRSTAMRAYLERLRDEKSRRKFEEMCLHEFERAYRAEPDGAVLFPYRRMFIVTSR
jgi:trans-aconitate 2-methyltransferase